MSHSFPFAQVDVFSTSPYGGNPVAVVLDADDFSDALMQRIAQWTNLSETTFIQTAKSPEADYRLRIFTPQTELPFAGHPTLGSAKAWLVHNPEGQKKKTIIQECAAGLIEIRQDGPTLSFAAPKLQRTGPIDQDYLDQIIAAYGIKPSQVVGHQWVDNGPGWAVLQLATAQEVLDLEPDFSLIPHAMVGAVGPYPTGSQHAFELRSFAPGVNVLEDPVCGSMNASVAQWLTSSGQAPNRYTVSQGTRLGRTGEIVIDVDEETIWVGGHATVCFFGSAIA